MSKFLLILSLLLKILAKYIDLFEAGWAISLYTVNINGRIEIRVVRHWWSRLFRGVRYLRGKEGRPEPKCDECGLTAEEHDILCPEEIKSLTAKEMIAKPEAEDVHSDND